MNLIKSKKEKNRKTKQFKHLWSLARMGARELLYGPVDRVIPPKDVSAWIENLMSQNWRNPKPVGVALAQMARKTGDRIRDLDIALINHIRDWMSQYEVCLPHIKYLEEVVPIAKQEESIIFGESLPSGIVIHA